MEGTSVCANTACGSSATPAPPSTRCNTQVIFMLRSGDVYWLDDKNCLHLKLTDLSGYPWASWEEFERNGLYLDTYSRWYDTWYEVVATGPPMSTAACTAHWCPLPVSVISAGAGSGHTLNS